MTTFTIGADPEIFLRKRGKAVSAHDLIPGTKSSPFKVSRGAVQADGTAAEFNIDPSNINDFETFNLNIVEVMSQLKGMVKGYSLNISPVQDYEEDYLKSLPEIATELGCDPDFNAYTLEENPTPNAERSFRSGAGHIHIGWGADIPTDNEEHREICASFVQMLDATVGLFMTYIDREPRRRELYGKAGAFRPKPYGVEYRTPSNVWITSKNRRRLVHALTQKAVRLMQNSYSIKQVLGIEPEMVREIIDTGNHVAAKMYLDRLFISMHQVHYTTWTQIEKQMRNVEEEKANDEAADAA